MADASNDFTYGAMSLKLREAEPLREAETPLRLPRKSAAPADDLADERSLLLSCSIGFSSEALFLLVDRTLPPCLTLALSAGTGSKSLPVDALFDLLRERMPEKAEAADAFRDFLSGGSADSLPSSAEALGEWWCLEALWERPLDSLLLLALLDFTASLIDPVRSISWESDGARVDAEELLRRVADRCATPWLLRPFSETSSVRILSRTGRMLNARSVRASVTSNSSAIGATSTDSSLRGRRSSLLGSV